MKAVLLTEKNKHYKTRAFIFPFYKYKTDLYKRFNFIFDELRIDYDTNRKKLSELNANFSNYDLVFIQLGGLLKSEERYKFLQKVKIKKILFDDSDSSGTCQFDLLPYVDLYIKKQFLKNLDEYKRPYLAERFFANYLIKLYGIKTKRLLRDYLIKLYDTIGIHKQILKDEFREKLILGWNLVTHERCYRQFAKQKFGRFKNGNRIIDINCRVGLKENEKYWYYFHRISILNELRKLGGEYRIINESRKMPIETYLNELRNSIICISPFGNGEICIRDLEAIINGCLLIKPSLEHIITDPNIFIPHKTYVPVKWDLNDLNEKCKYYLAHEEEKEKITENAEQAYAQYFKEKMFVTKIGEILSKLGF